jgi:predicted PhzF superfamily epimerase YddE/YHI9
MKNVYAFRVFTNEHGDFGDPGSLIIDESKQLTPEQRQAKTAEIGHVETVFVNDFKTMDLSIYHAHGQVDFAGTVLLGAAWQLSRLKGEIVLSIHCPRGNIQTWQDGDVTWLRASLGDNLGNWQYKELESPEAVESLTLAATAGWKSTMVWAWADEAHGQIRARTFAGDIDIPEVQGNGSGSMMLAGRLQRAIQVTHGDGSIIYARPAPNNAAELGGRVIAI